MHGTRTNERSAPGLLGGLAATATLLLWAPPPAAACGGFFCNRSAPVNQAAERIVFAKEADGTVRAIVEVKYDGPSEHFAWLLPVEGTPEVSVSSRTALDALQQSTAPSYTLQVRVEGECDPEPDAVYDGPALAGAAPMDGGAAPPDGSAVEVLDRGSVGPYDYVTLSVTDPDGDQVRVAVQWLQDNGYDVTEAQAARLRPYLASGQHLIAFRLTKGASTGSIRPIELTFGTGLPAIPIRPTAVAADDDMGVLVWLLGPARAYPVNYRSLVLNDALIDWFNPSRNYDEVVTAAADEAGGQGFVTEYAGRPEQAADAVYPDWTATQWTDLRDRGLRGGEAQLPELLFEFLNQFGQWDGVRDLLARTLDLSGEELDAFLRCPGCIDTEPVTWLRNHLRAGVTVRSFLEDAEDLVVAPVRRFAEQLRGHPWLTRLYTTMSPEEMTLDPMFDFSDALPEVSNVHTAVMTLECAPGYRQSEAPWRMELPSGQVVRGEGSQSWPFGDPATADMPATLRIERVGADGSMVVADHSERVRARLQRHNARLAALSSGRAAGGGGCSLSGASAVPSGGTLLVAVGLLGLGWRRRRPR